jgi:hypothetical protein
MFVSKAAADPNDDMFFQDAQGHQTQNQQVGHILAGKTNAQAVSQEAVASSSAE